MTSREPARRLDLRSDTSKTLARPAALVGCAGAGGPGRRRRPSLRPADRPVAPARGGRAPARHAGHRPRRRPGPLRVPARAARDDARSCRRCSARPPMRALRDAVNRYLNGVNATAGAEMLYVLDRGRHLAGRVRLGPARHHGRPGPVVPALRERRAGERAGPFLRRRHHQPQARATTCRTRCAAATGCAAWRPSRSTRGRRAARGASCRATCC